MKNSNIPKRHHQKVAKVKPSSKNGLSFDQKVRNLSALDFDFSCLTILFCVALQLGSSLTTAR
jgi:hypothetical protein